MISGQEIDQCENLCVSALERPRAACSTIE